MDLGSELVDRVKEVARGSPGGGIRANVRAGEGVTVCVDVATADSLGCAIQEMRLDVPWLAGAEFEVLKKWAEALSDRLQYLLEPIRPLEFSEQTGRVLIRSAPPGDDQEETRYYEIVLSSRAGEVFLLRRYGVRRGDAEGGRKRIDMQMTYELLRRVVNDVVASIPER